MTGSSRGKTALGRDSAFYKEKIFNSRFTPSNRIGRICYSGNTGGTVDFVRGGFAETRIDEENT